MPYPKLTDLPDNVKKLPRRGQEIWQAAFNSAFEEYDGDEEKCSATAWAAVKKAGYERDDGGAWQRGKESVITDALARLRPVDPTQFKVYMVGNDAVLLKDVKEQVGVLPYTATGGSVVFGQFRYPPVAETDAQFKAVVAESQQSEQFAAAKECEQVAFTVAEDAGRKANAEAGDWPVVIIQEGDNKGKRRRYTAKCLESADASKYVGLPMHLDHKGAEGKQESRSVAELVSRVTDAWHAVSESGQQQIRGMVHVFDRHLREKLVDSAFRSLVGLSHVADIAGRTERQGGSAWQVVESIVSPSAVDWVSKAAFGGRVAESQDTDPIGERADDLMALNTLTVADLKAQRPDLVTEVAESAVATFKQSVAENDETKQTAEQLATAQRERDAARLETHQLRVKVAVAEAVAKPDAGIPEAARSAVVSRVTDRLGSTVVDADKLSATVSEAVKSEATYLATVAPKPAANAGRGGESAPTGDKAGLQAMADKMLGIKTA